MAVLAWLVAAAAASVAASALPAAGAHKALCMITAATGVTALLFLLAVRRPWLRRRLDVAAVGELGLLATWTWYREECLRLAIYSAFATLMVLWAADPRMVPIAAMGEDRRWSLLFAGTAVFLYYRAAKAIRSMRHKVWWSGASHHPVLGVVLGSLPNIIFSLLGLVFMALSTWQVILPCVIAGAAAFLAALTTLWAVPTAKN
ncbi:hypothetical protein AB0C84_19655 [Actinomadura sp. NPDC048955]|uniref:hypothetical protein n=1 Tax=Actinomadura sp. NPDC048955 TaxID=3158228 RepID=UPI0033ED3056